MLLCGLSSCGERGLLFITVHRLLVAVASLVASTGSRHASFSSCSTWASAVHGSVKPGTTVGLQPSRLPPSRLHSPHVLCLRGLQTRLAPPLSTLDPTRRSVISAPTQTGSLPPPHPAEKKRNLLLGDVITPGCKWGGNFPSVHYSLWAPDKGVHRSSPWALLPSVFSPP